MNDTDRQLWEAELGPLPKRLPGHKRQPCLVTALLLAAAVAALWAVLIAIGWLAWDLARHWP